MSPRKPKNTSKKTSTLKHIPKSPPKGAILLGSNWEHLDPKNLDHPQLYINRELSWFDFNQRVLDQTYNKNYPLLERVKFLSIVGSNLDEFCMIRLAILLKRVRSGVEELEVSGISTIELFHTVQERKREMLKAQEDCWSQQLRPALEDEQIYFLEPDQYSEQVEIYITNYFKDELYPTLTPLAFDPGHPFPHISNLSLNLAVVVNHDDEIRFARVKIPEILDRFVPIPIELCPEYPDAQHVFVFLEDVIRFNLQGLFPGTDIEASYLFRVIRDTDIVIQEEESDDLLETIDRSLKQIRYGSVSSLQVEESMPQRVLDIFSENFQASEPLVTKTTSRMGFSDWMSLRNDLHLPKLKDRPFKQSQPFNDREQEGILDSIKYQDILVHHPYESFNAFLDFLKAAVEDPHVLAIKMTLYRIGNNSPVIDYLIQANEMGKQVAVLVELKARFDEKSNIVWARRLEAKGVHVVYGSVHLKTHCKLCLVVRKESEKIRRYAHIASGNYNPMTAKVYTDLGLFTANSEIVEDVSQVFNAITGYSKKTDYQHLMVAPLAFRNKVTALIERETQIAMSGKPAKIIIKVNSLADPEIIKLFYQASQAGVKIDLIIRGVCCLIPQVPGVSENIRVISIIGRLLEHSRVYYFHNNGSEEFYMGSADLMQRNLNRRVEVLCPVFDERHQHYLKHHLLDVMLSDNVRAYELQSSGKYERILAKKGSKAISAQEYSIKQHSPQ